MKDGAGYESAPFVFAWKRVGSSERPFGKSLLVLSWRVGLDKGRHERRYRLFGVPLFLF